MTLGLGLIATKILTTHLIEGINLLVHLMVSLLYTAVFGRPCSMRKMAPPSVTMTPLSVNHQRPLLKMAMYLDALSTSFNLSLKSCSHSLNCKVTSRQLTCLARVSHCWQAVKALSTSVWIMEESMADDALCLCILFNPINHFHILCDYRYSCYYRYRLNGGILCNVNGVSTSAAVNPKTFILQRMGNTTILAWNVI